MFILFPKRTKPREPKGQRVYFSRGDYITIPNKSDPSKDARITFTEATSVIVNPPDGLQL